MPTAEDKGKRRITPQAREAFRQELIAIARQIFLAEGHAAVTIRRVTATAGVTPMAFYWYFSSKDALMSVIWDGIVEACARECAHQARAHPAAQRLEAYLAAFIDFWLAHRDDFRFIFLNDSHGTDFVGLRRELFDRDGMQLHFRQLDALLLSHLPATVDAAAQVPTVRTLVLYRVFGFLHLAIGILGQPPEAARAHRDLVLADLRQSLALWTATPPAPP